MHNNATTTHRAHHRLRRIAALAVGVVVLAAVLTGAVLASRALAPMHDAFVQRVSASWDAARDAWSQPA